MVLSTVRTTDDKGLVATTPASAVSWGAILAGATGAAALSLILLILGTGLGLSSVSPWSNAGASAGTLGAATIAWVIFTQLLASGMGGYLAGRLRTKWTDVHTDEVYFRDTAHGFLAWSVASLATAALLTSVIGSILSGGVQAGTAATTLSATALAANSAAKPGDASPSGPAAYYVDALFRQNPAAPTPVPETPNPSVAEVNRIFLNGLRAGALPADDVRHVASLVAQRTGLSLPEAEKRVKDTHARAVANLHDEEAAAKAAADKARKASAHAALWLFISLLIGAFIASLAATHGGRQRDA
ncbi:MAG: hypothetical protein EOP38_10260 [Rubrivivax sp.]|nr:MAG: hypothetical protein EOP38_10260 [Rubrivivax sp.]